MSPFSGGASRSVLPEVDALGGAARYRIEAQ